MPAELQQCTVSNVTPRSDSSSTAAHSRAYCACVNETSSASVLSATAKCVKIPAACSPGRRQTDSTAATVSALPTASKPMRDMPVSSLMWMRTVTPAAQAASLSSCAYSEEKTVCVMLFSLSAAAFSAPV